MNTNERDLRLVEFDLLRAAEMAALNCIPWYGKGNKDAADAAACDAIRGMFDRTDMRGEIVIGEGIKDEAPGLFAGERVGTWAAGTPRLDIAIDPLDGTTNLSKGLPNAISCIAAALRTSDDAPVLQGIPAFYMKKLAYPPVVRRAWVDDPSLPLSVNAPIADVIQLTAKLLGKQVRDVVVMVIDRPRNGELIEEVRALGASLRMITDGDISAALAPALSNFGVDLYAGIGGAPEGILAAAGLRCLGGGMQAQMWPRDSAERQSLVDCGWSSHVDKVYRSRDLVHGDDIIFVATGISDSPLLRGVRANGSTLITQSVVMRQRTGSVRFVRTEHDLSRRPVVLRSNWQPPIAIQEANDVAAKAAPHRIDQAHQPVPEPVGREHPDRIPAVLLFGAPGSGKGTMAKALSAMPGCTHCSSGDIIRAAIAKSSGASALAKQVAAGELMSDNELFDLLDEFLENYNAQPRSEGDFLLIDGIPRCLSQVKELDRRVSVRHILYLECRDERILIERLRARFAADGRIDDADESVMRMRQMLFREQTEPLVREFPASRIHRIDATQPPPKVLRDILKHFEPETEKHRPRQLQSV